MEIALRKFADDVLVPDDDAYIAQVQDILENESFQSMKEFIQHGTTSCLAHCIAVSYHSYATCKKYGLHSRAAARAGLLHDLFLYDWHTHKAKKGDGMHGFTHPRRALQNAQKEFDLTLLEQEIILKHMWPLTILPPKSKEAYVVLYHDKICSLKETLGRPHLFIKAPAK
ncbi:HD family phosphohydrolase [Ruminococcaceae bacterium OttesenSCG-928-A16]|nr:HD family phosphohydrolase [Ruminococcaceae bacterium OttesenSCG-928-A16]